MTVSPQHLKKARKPKRTPKRKSLSGRTIVLCVTGSIAAYRACDLVRDLRALGADVICLMTQAAQQFVSPLTFHALSGNPVHTDPFSAQEDWNVLHTTLADRADLILIAPATADTIARLAAGFADNLVTSVVLASRARVLVVPAMNDQMYDHPITAQNIEKLKRTGYLFVGPVAGELVCGRTAVGHVAGNADIIRSVESLVSTSKRA